MPSTDVIVKFIICLWFSFAFLAGIALFFDKFLVPFIPKFQYIPYFFMLTSIVLPLFGLLSIYHTFCTRITYIANIFPLLISTALTILLQIVFVDQIIPFNSKFNSKYLIIQCIYNTKQYNKKRYKTIEIIHSQNLFQIIFNPVHGINTGTYCRTIHPQNLTLSIQVVFIAYMDELIEHNENLDTPVYLPSHLGSLKKSMSTLKYQISKPRNHDITILIIRYNKIYYKLNNSKTDSFKTSYLTKIQYHK